MKVGIIGGGPAGICAALEASKTFKNVTMIDKNDFLGRKLSTTGGGKGNLTNQNLGPTSYSAFHDFAFGPLIERYDYKNLIEYFENLGIYTYHTDDGWTYPISNSAKNVSSILENTILQNNISVIRNTTVVNIEFAQDKFLLSLDNGQKMSFDRLIISTGGKAHPQLNSSDSILDEIKRLGHRIVPSYPALSPMVTTKHRTKLLNGVRFDAETTIYNNGNCIARTFGNLIFTEWGVNGPGIMDLSHQIFRHPGKNTLRINFSNPLNKPIIQDLITKFNHSPHKLTNILLMLFPTKIVHQLLLNANLSEDILISQINYENLLDFMGNLSFEENINGTRGFEFAQISTGAVSSVDVDPLTLQSKIINNLYFAGEILDVIGPCGGYNLHWAFVSGIHAGRSIH